jgi:hypothetical protein
MAFACMLVFFFKRPFLFLFFLPFFYQHFAAAGPLTTIALLHASFVLAWGVRLAGVCVGVLGGAGVCVYVFGGGGIHMCIKGSCELRFKGGGGALINNAYCLCVVGGGS